MESYAKEVTLMQQQPDPYAHYPSARALYQTAQPTYTPPSYAVPPSAYGFQQPYSAAQAVSRRPTGRIAFVRGLLFGLLLILLVAGWVVAVSLPSGLMDSIHNAEEADVTGILSFLVSLGISLVQGLIAWIIYYFAGRSGARAGGKMSTGIYTCLWATLWYLMADFSAFFVLAGITANGFPDAIYVVSAIPGIMRSFSIDAMLALVGLAIGAAGASRGASRARR
jgi:hypothetical protein